MVANTNTLEYSYIEGTNKICFIFFTPSYGSFRGPDSVVGTATGNGMYGPGIESRRGTRFSATVQAGPGAHPANCKMGTGSFPGVNSGRGVTLTPHPLLVPWSRKNRAIPLLPYEPFGLYRASVPVQRCSSPFFLRLIPAHALSRY